MSSGANSSRNESVRPYRSSRTSTGSSHDLTDVNSSQPLLISSAKSKKVRMCTMCGRYEGFRIPRYLFIILCVLLGLLILLVLAVIGLYAIVPAIVRSTIAKAQLGFRSVSIEQIQNNGFRLRAQLELSNTGSIPATIVAPFVIHVDDVGTITNSESISISGGSNNGTIVPIDAPFVVTNIDAFNNFARSLIFQPNVTWHLKAEATIRPLSSHMLSYSNIPFNKDVTLNALNGLADVAIDSISLTRSDEHRIVVDIVIKIKNPSVFSIDLGRLFFTLEYNNHSIGYVESTTDNTKIHTGDNAVAFFGELQSTSSESFDAISVVIRNFLTNRTSHVSALAGPNCTSYPLLAAGMRGLSLSVDMPPFDEQLVASLKFNSMSLIPSTMDKTVALSASIVIKINSPLGANSPLDIERMDMSVSLVYENDSVGMLNVLEVPVTQIDAITYQAQFDDKILILDGTGATYARFVQDFLKANETNLIHFSIAGIASVVGSFALGPLKVAGVHVVNDVALVGLDGLSKVRVDGISVDGEDGNALRITINATIENTGITDVQLDSFSLYMAEAKNNTILGLVPVDVLALQPGLNEVTLHGLLAPLYERDLPVVGRFFSAYLNNQTQAVKLFNNQSFTDNATALDLTVAGLSMQANLDGIEAKLIRQVDVLDFGIEFDVDDVNKVYVTGELAVLFELPSNVHMTFKALTTSIDFVMRFNDGPAMSRMVLIDVPVQHNQTTNEVYICFKKQQLIVLDNASFEEFAANLVLTTNVSVSVEGSASALAQIRIGNLTLTDMPVNNTLELVGYNQFDNGLLKIDNIDINGAISSEALALQVKTRITNPSVVNMIYGGRLLLDLYDRLSNTSLGLVNIDPFYLDPKGNDTVVIAEGIFNMTENNTVIARQFISNMVSGIDNEVELRGTLEDNSTGTNIPLLQLAIGGLRIQSMVPGLSGEKALLRELRVKKLTAAEIAGITVGLVKRLLTRIRIVNPFNTSITLQTMDIRADNGDKVDENHQVGVVHDNIPLKIGPYEELITPYVNVTITGKLTTLAALIGPLLAGNAHLSLTGTITVVIGDDFVLKQLPVNILNIPTDQEHAHFQ